MTLTELICGPNLRRSLADAARQRVEQCYSLASMVETYRRLYLQLAGVPTQSWEMEPRSGSSVDVVKRSAL